VVGGTLEYLSLITGYQFLLIVTANAVRAGVHRRP